jgi:cell division protein FtsI/penicillin-binding protein 2
MRARGALVRISPDRAKFTFWVFAAIGLYLTWRLFDIQVLHGPAYSREALEQRAQTIEIFARRGTIYDRTRTVLVRSLKSESVYADPTQITDKPGASTKLAPILGYQPGEIEAALNEQTHFRWLKRKVSHETAEAVRALGIQGINIVQEETGRRFWTSGRLASNVLGFVGMDENGLSGVEYSYDNILQGTSGKMMLEADPFQRALPFGQQHVIDKAHPGRSLVLTLDGYLQFEAEHLLDAQVREFHARSGSVLVMDPRTGEILAMANAPDFDPAHYNASKPDAWRDRAITDAYEPGSTFKLITAAAALESGKVNTKSRFPALDQLKVNGSVIHNAEDEMPLSSSTESLEDIIAYSHNVGAAEVAMRIGGQAEYREISKFGFGEATGVDLPGESTGILLPLDEWSGTSLPTIAFGQGVSTTPLAMARAYCAIANGGMLLEPHIVRAVLDENGKTVRTYGPKFEGRVMSQETAATLRSFLRTVVVRGTGNPSAHVAGYTTAGKTGTAQVVGNGGYVSGAYIASFIGYIPAEHPRFVILVKIDEPRGAYYGSIVAAPVFSKLAQIAMIHDGVFPAQPPARLVPPKRGAKVAAR